MSAADNKQPDIVPWTEKEEKYIARAKRAKAIIDNMGLECSDKLRNSLQSIIERTDGICDETLAEAEGIISKEGYGFIDSIVSTSDGLSMVSKGEDGSTITMLLEFGAKGRSDEETPAVPQ